MPIATFSGLASGIDTGSLITQLVQLERIPIKRLESKQDDMGSIKSRLNELKKRLAAVQSAGEGLASRSDILGATATSSDEGRLAVTATGDAPKGSYTLTVSQLAAAERTYSNGFADSSSTGLFGSGTLSIQVGADAAVDITVDPTDSLSSLASKINASNARVNAAVIFDGTTHRLQVSAQDSGSTNAVSFTETGTTLGLDDPTNERVAAADAVFEIDGLAMTRPNNQVADAIPGVTLDLYATTDTVPVVISVDRDTTNTLEKVQTFVDAFNNVVRGINAESVFTGKSRVGDSLSGDSMLRNLQSALSRSVVDPVAGLGAPGDRLAEFGVRLANNGTLELDEEALTAALAADPDALVRFFEGDPAGGIDGFIDRLDGTLEAYAGSEGLIASRTDGIDDEISRIDLSIEAMELRLVKFEDNLRAKFTNLELVVSQLNAQSAQLQSILSQLQPA